MEKNIVSILMDRQPWYDWVEFKLANGKVKKGKVEIYTYLEYNEWEQAVRQLLNEKYGYNINFIPTLKNINQGKIKFGNF